MATDTAKIIRSELKTLGYTSRDVSVRARSCAVDVRIRHFGVPFRTVKELASKHAHVRYCEVSGDMLEGGNTFVHVDYAADALEPLIGMIRNLLADGRTVFGSLTLDLDSRNPDCLHAWDREGMHVAQISREHGARAFARVLAERGELACLGTAPGNDVEPAPAPVDYSGDPNFALC